MDEVCKQQIHNYEAVHDGLVGGQTLVQCQLCKTIAVMWSAVLNKKQEQYKAFLGEVSKEVNFLKVVKDIFGGKKNG